MSIEEVLSKRGNHRDALTRMSTNTRTFSNIQTYPSDFVSSILYIGVEDEGHTRLKKEEWKMCIEGNSELYTKGEKQRISALRITHGATLFAFQGIRDMKNSYDRLAEQGNDLLEAYKEFDDLMPEEWE